MWWWVGAGLTAVLSVVCVPAITSGSEREGLQ